MDAKIETTARKIEKIDIQGAANIGRAALDAISALLLREPKISKTALRQNCDRLIATRPTEPMLQNAMRFVLDGFMASGREGALAVCVRVSRVLDESRSRIASHGYAIIKNDGTVFTHCHSSSVMEIFKMARDRGKKFSIICTETRPLFQGRKTVRDALALGIPVTMVVDSAVNSFMPDADVVMVGCDAFVPEGLINKIGTSQVALSAREHKKPLYCALSLLKFTQKCEIEERDPSELGSGFERTKKGVVVRNPAFDLTPAKHIAGAITEAGILKPSMVGRSAKTLIHTIEGFETMRIL